MERTKPHEPWEPAVVAHRLIALRQTLGMNKVEFAARIGIDKSSYTKIEKGDKPLQTAAAYKIWQLWGVDLNFIYLGQIGGLPQRLSSTIITHLNGDQPHS